MATKPILFSTPMVRAILDGEKTVTRRVVTGKGHDGEQHPIPLTAAFTGIKNGRLTFETGTDIYSVNPKYQVGDILWVREKWCERLGDWRRGRYIYKAHKEPQDYMHQYALNQNKWRPSIHMPKSAARLFLRVTGVRVERLQDMDEEDAIMEGFADSAAGTDSPLTRFVVLWDKLLRREDRRALEYDATPWVWVIELERTDRPKGWPEVEE